MTSLSYSPSPSFAVVVDVVSRALKRWPEDRTIIGRAATLLATGAVSPHCPISYAVRVQNARSVTYIVTADACSCRRRDCVHRWACDLLTIAVDRQRVLDARSLAPMLSATISQELAPCR